MLKSDWSGAYIKFRPRNEIHFRHLQGKEWGWFCAVRAACSRAHTGTVPSAALEPGATCHSSITITMSMVSDPSTCAAQHTELLARLLGLQRSCHTVCISFHGLGELISVIDWPVSRTTHTQAGETPSDTELGPLPRKIITGSCAQKGITD